MTQIIFDPDAAQDFQMYLMNASHRIEHACANLQGSFTGLGSTWKDAKYDQFGKLFEETMRGLAQFNKEMYAYLDYLQRKERAIREYLESGY